MLRARVAALLRADGAIVGALPGGIYPLADGDPSVLAPALYPAAFDAFGDVLPCALVRDGGTFGAGPRGALGGQAIVDVLLWEPRGRATIAAVLPLIRRALDGVRADTSAHHAYRLTYAGESPALRDQALRDAEHAWSRWQTAYTIK